MINWVNILYNLFWILGAALLLATFSFAYWRAAHQSFRQILSAPSFRRLIAASLILFALGMMLTADFWWSRVGWAGLMAFLLWQGVADWRRWFGSS